MLSRVRCYYISNVCVLFCSAHNRWLTYSAFVVLHNDSQPGFAALWMLSDVYDSYAAYVVLVILFEFIQTKKKLYKSLFRRFFFNDITANLLLFFVCLWFYTTLILYVVVIRCSTFAILACGCSLLILGRFVRVFRYYEFILRGWLLQQKKENGKWNFFCENAENLSIKWMLAEIHNRMERRLWTIPNYLSIFLIK